MKPSPSGEPSDGESGAHAYARGHGVSRGLYAVVRVLSVTGAAGPVLSQVHGPRAHTSRRPGDRPPNHKDFPRRVLRRPRHPPQGSLHGQDRALQVSGPARRPLNAKLIADGTSTATDSCRREQPPGGFARAARRDLARAWPQADDLDGQRHQPFVDRCRRVPRGCGGLDGL